MHQAATHAVRYAAVFREGSGPVAAGAVVVEGDGLVLRGRHDGKPVCVTVPYEEVAEVRLGHNQERLKDHRTIVLTRRTGAPVQIAPLGFGLRGELADMLAPRVGTAAGATGVVAIVVPLRSGAEERVRALVAQGPPFDAAALGLVRHEVYLTPSEVVFVVEGPDIEKAVSRAIEEPGFWRAGLSWRECTAGAPRLASAALYPMSARELVYSWVAEQM